MRKHYFITVNIGPELASLDLLFHVLCCVFNTSAVLCLLLWKEVEYCTVSMDVSDVLSAYLFSKTQFF